MTPNGILHQDIPVQAQPKARNRLLQEGDHLGIVPLATEDGPALVAPGGHMIPSAWDMDSWGSGHRATTMGFLVVPVKRYVVC